MDEKNRRTGLQPISPISFGEEDEREEALVVETPQRSGLVDQRVRREPEKDDDARSGARRRVMTLTLPDEGYRDQIEAIAAQVSQLEGEEVAPSTMAMRLLLAALEAWNAGALTLQEEVTKTVTHKLKWQGPEVD